MTFLVQIQPPSVYLWFKTLDIVLAQEPWTYKSRIREENINDVSEAVASKGVIILPWSWSNCIKYLLFCTGIRSTDWEQYRNQFRVELENYLLQKVRNTDVEIMENSLRTMITKGKKEPR